MTNEDRYWFVRSSLGKLYAIKAKRWDAAKTTNMVVFYDQFQQVIARFIDPPVVLYITEEQYKDFHDE